MTKPPSAVLVAGMHRSGTSATTGALRFLGVELGDRLMAGATDNPRGYFEHEGIVGIHEALLRELGSWWSDPRPLPEAWLSSPAARRAEDAIVAVLGSEFGASPVWAIKDPRMCRLLPLWRRCLQRLDVDHAVLHVVRSPAEVALSLRKRNGFSPLLGTLLWLRHVLHAIRDSADSRRAVVIYDDLLAAPERAMRRALAALGVSPRGDASPEVAAMGDFVDASFRHHTAPSGRSNESFSALADHVFQAYVMVSRGDAEWAALDPLLDEFEREWRKVEGLSNALIDAVFPTIDGFGRLQADAAEARSQLAAQVRWAESAVEEHRAVVEKRDQLATEHAEATVALTQLRADLSRAQSELAAQVRWAESAVEEHRAVVEKRDQLAAEHAEATVALTQLRADLSRAQSELAAQVRWAESAVEEHRAVVEKRDQLAAEHAEATVALTQLQADLSRAQSELSAQVRWAESAVEEHRAVVEKRDQLAAELAEATVALTQLRADLSRAQSELAAQVRWAESAVEEHRAAVEKRDQLAAELAEAMSALTQLRVELSGAQSELSAQMRWTELAVEERHVAVEKRDQLAVELAESDSRLGRAQSELAEQSRRIASLVDASAAIKEERDGLQARLEERSAMLDEERQLRVRIEATAEALSSQVRDVRGDHDALLARFELAAQALGRQAHEIQGLRDALSSSELALRAVLADKDGLQLERDDLARRLATSEEDAAALRSVVSQSSASIEDLAGRIDAIEKSRSWRWTAPFRAVGARVRRS